MFRAGLLRPEGHVFGVNGDGSVFAADTWQCRHCGAHHEHHPGSGRTRAYCQGCAGFVCVRCADQCVPQELLVENIEKGRPLDYRPIVASVPRLLTE